MRKSGRDDRDGDGDVVVWVFGGLGDVEELDDGAEADYADDGDC